MNYNQRRWMFVQGASKSDKAPNGSTYLECAESEEIKNLLKWRLRGLARLLLVVSICVTISYGPTTQLSFFMFCVVVSWHFSAGRLNFGTSVNLFHSDVLFPAFMCIGHSDTEFCNFSLCCFFTVLVFVKFSSFQFNS